MDNLSCIDVLFTTNIHTKFLNIYWCKCPSPSHILQGFTSYGQVRKEEKRANYAKPRLSLWHQLFSEGLLRNCSNGQGVFFPPWIAAPEPDIILTLWIKQAQGHFNTLLDLQKRIICSSTYPARNFCWALSQVQHLQDANRKAGFSNCNLLPGFGLWWLLLCTALIHTTQHQWEQRKKGR